MKLTSCAKRLLVVLLLIQVSCAGFSQTSPDSVTCIPNSDLRRAVAIINEHEFVKLELQAKDVALIKIQKQLENKNRTIQQLRDKQSASTQLIAALKKTNSISEEQLKLKETVNESYRKEVRKANTRTWLVGIAGIVLTAFTAYITTR